MVLRYMIAYNCNIFTEKVVQYSVETYDYCVADEGEMVGISGKRTRYNDNVVTAIHHFWWRFQSKLSCYNCTRRFPMLMVHKRGILDVLVFILCSLFFRVQRLIGGHLLSEKKYISLQGIFTLILSSIMSSYTWNNTNH